MSGSSGKKYQRIALFVHGACALLDLTSIIIFREDNFMRAEDHRQRQNASVYRRRISGKPEGRARSLHQWRADRRCHHPSVHAQFCPLDCPHV